MHYISSLKEIQRSSHLTRNRLSIFLKMWNCSFKKKQPSTALSLLVSLRYADQHRNSISIQHLTSRVISLCKCCCAIYLQGVSCQRWSMIRPYYSTSLTVCKCLKSISPVCSKDFFFRLSLYCNSIQTSRLCLSLVLCHRQPQLIPSYTRSL